MRIAAC